MNDHVFDAITRRAATTLHRRGLLGQISHGALAVALPLCAPSLGVTTMTITAEAGAITAVGVEVTRTRKRNAAASNQMRAP